MNDSNAFTLLLKQEHHNETHKMKKKLHSIQHKYKIAVKSETSYKAKLHQMERKTQRKIQHKARKSLTLTDRQNIIINNKRRKSMDDRKTDNV